ncbi:MAG: cbb3-type cytochrome c oxidase subunit I [Chloroflexi bacterium]|nr:cbb3-type cytochrome c oxidase subunit I [Chloroflexota bacterium]
MSKTTLGFIFSGMAYLLIGVVMGVLFLFLPGTQRLANVHAHLNLVGFVIFLIFGIGYHILPRFKGRPLFSERLAWWQFWVSNIGLIGLVIFMGIGAFQPSNGLRYVAATFGALLMLGVVLFVYNMLRTLVPPARR